MFVQLLQRIRDFIEAEVKPLRDPEKLKERFLQARLFVLRLFASLILGPTESFNFFTQQNTVEVVTESFYGHKEFHEKARLFSASTLSVIIASVVIVSLFLNLVISPALVGRAATFTKTWTSYNDYTYKYGADTDDQTTQTNVVIQDPANATTAGGTTQGTTVGTVSLSTTTSSVSETSDTDFNAGTQSQTAVSGSGSGASEVLGEAAAANGALISTFGGGVVQNNPSASGDVIYSIAIDSSYIYAGGYDTSLGGSNYQWRIEKRDKTTGALVSAFGTSGVVTNNPSSSVDIIQSIAIDSSYLYAGGYDLSPGNYQWRIEKRDITTGALVSAFGTSGVVTNNPSSGTDIIYSLAIDSSYLYAGGYDSSPGNDQWRIEKRDITTGALVSAFGTEGVMQNNPSSGNDDIHYIAIDSSYLYAGGSDASPVNNQWRIEKRDITTGALVSAFGTEGVMQNNPSSGSDIIYSITGDSSYIYVGGSDASPGNYQWRIEKRDKTTGTLVSAFGTSGVVTNNPSSGTDVTYSIAVDSSYLYIGGGDASPGNDELRIEKRDITTGALVSAFGTEGVMQNNPSSGSDAINSIAIDSSYVYAGGYDYSPGNSQWRIEKRDITTSTFVSGFNPGVITSNPSTSVDIIQSIAIDSSYLYAGGYDRSATFSQWRIEKRDITTGALVSAFGTSGVIQNNPSGNDDSIQSIAIDSSYIYAGGYDYSPGNSQWRIEKRDITTGALVSAFGTSGVIQNNPSGNTDTINSIAIDSSYIYAGGYDSSFGSINPQWRIEKRDITTGALVTAFGTSGVVTNNPSSGADIIYSIAVDSSYLYAGGRDNSPGNNQWRIEKRDITTGALVSAFGTSGIVQNNPSSGDDYIYSIAIDSSYIYAGGRDVSTNSEWRIEKRDKTTGALISGFGTSGVVTNNPSSGTDIIYSIAIDSSYLYAGGYDNSPGNDQWRIEKRDITTGALVTAFGTSGVIQNNPSSGADIIQSIAIDSSYIYAGGNDVSPGGSTYQWHIEKRNNGPTYYSSGTFTSAIKDTGGNASLGTLSYTWNSTQTLAIKARTSDSATMVGATAFTSCTAISSGTDMSTLSGDGTHCVTNGHRYIQYEATLSTSDTSATPQLNDVTLAYNIYNSSGSITNIIQDASATATWSSISWNADTSGAGTSVKFRIRTASTEGGLTAATWSDYATTSPTTFSTLTPAPEDNRWAELEIDLATTDQGNTPTLYDVAVIYVRNAPPEFDSTFGSGTGITVSQYTAAQSNPGKVGITYAVRDQDTNSNNTSVASGTMAGKIRPIQADGSTSGFEYNTGSGWNPITSTYLANGAADLDRQSVDTTVCSPVTTSCPAYTQYAVIWDAKTQINGVYTAAAQVRVTANDNEASNNTVTSTVSNITIDTKNPDYTGINPIVLDAVNNQLTLKITDDSTTRMVISNNSNLTADSSNVDSGNNLAYGTDANSDGYGDVPLSATVTKSWTPSSGTTSTAYVQYTDSYGNYTSTLSATTPVQPQNVVIRDLSNAAISEYRLFVAWQETDPVPTPGFKHYRVMRSTDDSSYSQLGNLITDIDTNYILDQNLTANTTYYYKIYVEDNNGNRSKYSATVNDKANGQGGTDATAPTVTTPPAASGITTNQATITWVTDELSNSRVEYSTQANFASSPYSIPVISSTMATAHSVVLTGLAPATTYKYRIKSTDPSTNVVTDDNSSSAYSFTTNSGPTISTVSVTSVANTTATVKWTTDTASTSYVDYSINSDLSSNGTLGSSTPATDHLVNLAGLTSGTKYYFQIRSTVGNDTALDNNGTNYYTFTTTSDTAPPTIQDVASSSVGETFATISWTTDEPATTQVEYGLTNAYGSSTTLDSNLTTSHSAAITGLVASTVYHYRVISADGSANSTTGGDNTFTTADTPSSGGGSGSNVDKSSPTISNVAAKVLGPFSVSVSWTTSESATSFVEYKAADESSFDMRGEFDRSLEHIINITKLVADTVYTYRVISEDASGNIARSQEDKFKTMEAGAKTEEAPVKVKAEEEVKPAEVKEEAPSETAKPSTSTPATSVTQTLIQSVSAVLGQQGVNALENLLQQAGASIPAPKIVGTTPSVEASASVVLVRWTTDRESNSLVAFAEAQDYNPQRTEPYTQIVGNPDERVTDHIVKLLNLKPATTYHYQLRSSGLIGEAGKSNDLTFTTLAETPQITSATPKIVGQDSATITWTTNLPTDSIVRYTPVVEGKALTDQAKVQGTSELTNTHTVTITGLEQGTQYNAEILGRDAYGNQVTQSLAPINTGKDTAPPTISQIRTSTAVIPGKTVTIQTIISWKTDEPSTSEVTWQEGSTENKALEHTTPLLSDPVTDHLVVITQFQPATIYRFSVKSKDASGNETVSRTFTILTPRQEQTVLQIIVKNFQDLFPFTK